MNSLAWTKPSVVGMVHLASLPGSPRFAFDLNKVTELAISDAQALQKGGVSALMIENFGDAPFCAGRVSSETVSAMTFVAAAVRRETNLPIGINVLRNDGISALHIAQTVGAQFIRVNVLTGARVTDQGLIQGIAFDLLRERARLRAENIQIFADVDVKHSVALAERLLEDEVRDLVARGFADAVIVSGAGTGLATDPEKVERVAKVASGVPVFLGSGVNEGNFRKYNSATGFIVGTAFKKNGKVDADLVSAFMKSLRQSPAD